MELLAQRQIDATLSRTGHDPDPGVAKGAGRRYGIRRGVKEQHSRPNVVRIVRLAVDVSAEAAGARSGRIAARLDRQRETGVRRIDTAELPPAEDSVQHRVPRRAELLLTPERRF